jgi:hypothetical protein
MKISFVENLQRIILWFRRIWLIDLVQTKVASNLREGILSMRWNLIRDRDQDSLFHAFLNPSSDFDIYDINIKRFVLTFEYLGFGVLMSN